MIEIDKIDSDKTILDIEGNETSTTMYDLKRVYMTLTRASHLTFETDANIVLSVEEIRMSLDTMKDLMAVEHIGELA